MTDRFAKQRPGGAARYDGMAAVATDGLDTDQARSQAVRWKAGRCASGCGQVAVMA